MNKKFKITYDIEFHDKGLTQKEIKEKGKGGCDKILVASISNINNEVIILGKDGYSGDKLKDEDLFLVWIKLAEMLSYPICQEVMSAVYRENIK